MSCKTRTPCFARVMVDLAVILTGLPAALAGAGGYEELEVADGGSIVGTARFVGTLGPPAKLLVGTDPETCGTEDRFSRALLVDESGGVQNAVINLREIPSGRPWPEKEYHLRQADCRFDPHILLIPEGEDLHITNTDRVLHIVRSHSKDSVFNVGQPRFVEQMLVENFARQISEPKAVRLICDIHGWMEAYAIIQRHPYYAVTGHDGSFRLDDVPAGSYILEFWHEALGEASKEVTVLPNTETAVEFERALPQSPDG
ncbi:MAG: carboxypeptidase regulatory-like domain-containing protein [Thermoanaerobaculia bacterium]